MIAAMHQRTSPTLLVLACLAMVSFGPACDSTSAAIGAGQTTMTISGTDASTATIVLNLDASATVGLASVGISATVDVPLGSESLSVMVTPAGGTAVQSDLRTTATISGVEYDRYRVQVDGLASECTEGSPCTLTMELSAAAGTAPAADLVANVSAAFIATGPNATGDTATFTVQ